MEIKTVKTTLENFVIVCRKCKTESVSIIMASDGLLLECKNCKVIEPIALEEES